MILTDGTHLVSDTSVAELHEFALRKAELPPRWFHDGGEFPYYELLGTELKVVMRLGAARVASGTLKRRAAR